MSRLQKVTLAVLLLLGLALVAQALRPPKVDSGFDDLGFGTLPSQEGGRIKPLDTVARTSLLMLSGKQSLRTEAGRVPAVTWMAEVMLRPDKANELPCFRIDHPEVVALLGSLNEEKKYFTPREIGARYDALQAQFARISPEPAQRDPYQRALVKLQESIQIYEQLVYALVPPPLFGDAVKDYQILGMVQQDLAKPDATEDLRANARQARELLGNHYARLGFGQKLQIVPPTDPTQGKAWAGLGEQLLADVEAGRPADAVLLAYADLAAARAAGDGAAFDAALGRIRGLALERAPEVFDRVPFEKFFNRTEPFYLAMELYGLVFLVAVVSWLVWGAPLARAASWLMWLAFIVHTFGLFARIYIQGRPPVTNLYSSAIFVGWAAVPLCTFIETRLRNAVAAATAALLGFCTLIVAHHLPLTGDTLEVMRAVLDSNFWLATHVPTVTIGYSATFLAGFLAAMHLIRTRLPGGLAPEAAAGLERAVYGVTCFALLFSFTGTVLGGIWADQSWGRFWGWDPKENGALMIVLWNAVYLHARWGKIARPETLMQIAVFGNVITAWSWFGTNMLGVGLHSYGFMDQAFVWLMIFNASQLLILSLGWLPESTAKSQRA